LSYITKLIGQLAYGLGQAAPLSTHAFARAPIEDVCVVPEADIEQITKSRPVAMLSTLMDSAFTQRAAEVCSSCVGGASALKFVG
jgi:hypothetical protein